MTRLLVRSTKETEPAREPSASVLASGLRADAGVTVAVIGIDRILSSVASICGLVVLLGALLRAPEGYEDETGFHIGALADAVLS